LHSSPDLRAPPPFPTRRSSDLEPNTLLHARLPLFRPDRRLGRLADRMSWAFTPVFTVTAMIVVLVTLAIIAQNLPVLARSALGLDRKSTRLNSSHVSISYAVFC